MTTTRRAPPTSMSRTPTPAVDRPLPAAEARDASNRLATTCDPYISDDPVYYISRRARGHDDADDSSRRLATTWDPHIYQTTLYIIYHVGPACMTTPTTHQADWQLHGTPIYIRPLHTIYHVGPAAMKAPTPELQPATHHPAWRQR